MLNKEYDDNEPFWGKKLSFLNNFSFIFKIILNSYFLGFFIVLGLVALYFTLSESSFGMSTAMGGTIGIGLGNWIINRNKDKFLRLFLKGASLGMLFMLYSTYG